MLETRLEIYSSYSKIVKFVNVMTMEYLKAFKYIYQVTNITKYHDFQYRLLVNAIHANNKLFYWKVKPTEGCDYCDCAYQNVVHMLYDCQIIRPFWTQFHEFTKGLLIEADKVVLNFTTIFLNDIYSDLPHVINLLLLATKQYIYRCKCQNVHPSFQVFEKEIRKLYNMEHYNAKVKQRLLYHRKKWQPYTKEIIIEYNVQSPENVPNDAEYLQNYLLDINCKKTSILLIQFYVLPFICFCIVTIE